MSLAEGKTGKREDGAASPRAHFFFASREIKAGEVAFPDLSGRPEADEGSLEPGALGG